MSFHIRFFYFFPIFFNGLSCSSAISSLTSTLRRVLPLIVFCAAYAVLAALATIVIAGPALAIPSPELVVGSLTSLSQLAAVGSALLGGGAVALGSRLGRSVASNAVIKSTKRLAVLFAGLAVTLLALNIYQWSNHRQAERAQLEASLTRPTPKGAKGKTLDSSLKELSYTAQTQSPLGITTDAAAAIIGDIERGGTALPSSPWMILDIRESAEVEMGTFHNARAVRFPDIANAGLDFTHQRPLLICHNGNRSAETCARLKAQGIDCRFLIGGLEKWISEGRRIGDAPARSLGEIRSIPDYPNHRVLLTTADVKTLVAQSGAIFVDVRYPGEFEASHLNGAINVPMRPTSTTELSAMLDALPTHPIIAPCYDRRSCFFAEILGLEVTRRGGDFRGRYTLPWDYFEAPRTPPYVAEYLAEHNRSTWNRMGDGLRTLLASASNHLGFPLALFLLALLSRILVLPFSLKAERDQIVSREIADEIAEIKAQTESDGGRRSRLIRQLYRKHGLTPVRNLLALAFLPVLALSVEATVHVAGERQEAFLWVPSLAGSDPLHLLPLGFSFFLCLYVDWALVASRRQRLAVWLVVAPLLFVAGLWLPAAADLYVIFSALLLLTQRAFVGGGAKAVVTYLARSFGRWRDRGLERQGIFSLDNRASLFAAGNKAYRLAMMREAGLPVPNAYVLTDAFLATWPSLAPRQQAQVSARIARRLGGPSFAVRSSGSGEDGADASFAGVFESVLNVKRTGLSAAIDQVAASFTSERAESYGAHGPGCNIVIQRMLEPDHAGVLFTRAPDAPGAMLIESVEGCGEALVSGVATPISFKVGRYSRTHLSGPTPGYEVSALFDLACRIEDLFDRTQDIEWAYADGNFHILQARDVTTERDDDAALAEWRRISLLVSGERPDRDATVLHRTQMGEMLPRPTPLSLSLLNDLWAPGGSVDLAMRGLGISAPFEESERPLYMSVQGLLYADVAEELKRKPRLSALSLRRIRRAADSIADDFEQHWIGEAQSRARFLDAVDYGRLPLNELVALIGEMRQRFVQQTYVDVDAINIAAQIYADDMRRAFEAKGIDPLFHMNGALNTRLGRELAAIGKLDVVGKKRALEKAIGHRAHFDYELSEPRFGEDPTVLARMGLTMLSDGLHAEGVSRKAMDELPQSLSGLFQRARRFEALKEDGKHIALRELAHIRWALEALAALTQLGGTIYFLTFDEIAKLNLETLFHFSTLAQQRHGARAALSSLSAPPAEISISVIEAAPFGIGERRPSGDGLRGTRVSGREAVCGRACVISREDAETGQPIHNFRPGDIIVAPMLHPSWLPQLVEAGGAISEVGGWLSHMAIVARERGIAMITGVSNLPDIENGVELSLESDGQIRLVSSIPRRSALAAE